MSDLDYNDFTVSEEMRKEFALEAMYRLKRIMDDRDWLVSNLDTIITCCFPSQVIYSKFIDIPTSQISRLKGNFSLNMRTFFKLIRNTYNALRAISQNPEIPVEELLKRRLND